MSQRGDARLGAALRQLRLARGLTQTAVARRAGCAVSLLSQVESGTRALAPWLVEALDQIYETGGVVVAMATGPSPSQPVEAVGDVILIRVPWRGGVMPVSRRVMLAALAAGALGGVPGLNAVIDGAPADEQTLDQLTRALAQARSAGRIVPPGTLLDTLTGHAAVIDQLRKRAPRHLRRPFAMLQARCAESLSWLSEESGDFAGAAYWTDRVQAWAQLAGWPAMWAYGNVRRSMIAITAGRDGHAAVEYAELVRRSKAALPDRLLGFAAYQVARGFALVGAHDACRQAIDESHTLFSRDDASDDPAERVGQQSVAVDDLMIMYRATCDTYAGGSELAITQLAGRLPSIGVASARSHAIQSGILALGYTHAGDPGLACAVMLATLDTGAQSATALGDLRQAAATLASRWPQRDDVREVTHRLTVAA